MAFESFEKYQNIKSPEKLTKEEDKIINALNVLNMAGIAAMAFMDGDQLIVDMLGSISETQFKQVEQAWGVIGPLTDDQINIAERVRENLNY